MGGRRGSQVMELRDLCILYLSRNLAICVRVWKPMFQELNLFLVAGLPRIISFEYMRLQHQHLDRACLAFWQ